MECPGETNFNHLVLVMKMKLTISQIAIAKFFDGEAADPVAEARSSQSASTPSLRPTQRSALLNGSPSFPRSPRSPSREAAPRIVPQPESQKNYRPPLFFAVILTPFNILYHILSKSVSLFGYLFPFLPRLLPRLSASTSPARSRTGRRSLNPRDTAARFNREFEEEYGNNNLPFYEGGYAQAYDLAKKDLKFLMVVLLSPEHDDTSTFVRETLLSPEVVHYINDPQNNIILWAGNVQDSEAYQVSTALNCSKFPFTALVAHTPQDSSTSMSTIARITGVQSTSSFAAKLRTGVVQNIQALDRIRTTRNEQQASRNLREEQNSAYERSLAQDRERARQRRETEASRKKAEQEEEERVAAIELQAHKTRQWKVWRAHSIVPEPGVEAKEAVRVSIRLASGERVVRRFAGEIDIEEVYAVVDCFEILQSKEVELVPSEPIDYRHKYGFRLVSPIPRVVYDAQSKRTIGDQLGRSANLIVELFDDEEGT